MVLETYQDLPDATDKEVMDFLREEIYFIMEKANMKKRIFVAAMNTILNEVEKRLRRNGGGIFTS